MPVPSPVEERSVQTVSEESWEPVSLADAREQLYDPPNAQDSRILSYVTAAREFVEEDTNRALVRKKLRLTLDAFPSENEIRLPRPPLVAHSTSTPIEVVYTKQDGTEATFSSTRYFVDTQAEPGRIVLKHSQQWPATVLRPSAAVKVTYSAGYASANAVPARAKQYMQLLVSHWFENREGVLVGTVSKEIELATKALRAKLLVPEVP